ncbi:MAG: hypothetical protein ACC609_12985 [Methanobacterium formicicum]
MGKKLQLFLLLVVLFGVVLISSFYLFPVQKNTSTVPVFSSVVLGETEYGTVTRDGPYGNASSGNRIAYIVGVHPLEYQAHDALVESVKNQNKSLKNCYYIYRVNVTQGADDYDHGRANGQALAYTYVVPDVKNSSIDLAIDVHSNEGNYQEKWFLFIPGPSEKAESIAHTIKNGTNWLTVYSPPNPTSPAYVTIPLIQAGIPAIIYETYTYESVQQSQKHADEIVTLVDQLKLN